MRPVVISPKAIRPLPESMWNMACSLCDKRQSKWELPSVTEDSKVACSVCLLASDLFQGQREDLEVLILEIEKERGGPFDRDVGGNLVPIHADQVLAAIAMTSRMFSLQSKMQGLKSKV